MKFFIGGGVAMALAVAAFLSVDMDPEPADAADYVNTMVTD